MARNVLVCIVIGIGVAIVVNLGRGFPPPFQQLALSALVSTLIYAIAQILIHLLWPWIARREGGRRFGVLAGIFFFAGISGYLLVVTGEILMRGEQVEFPWQTILYPLLVMGGGIAIVVGLSIYTFDFLNDRLTASVARLKEAEFAERELVLARGLQSRLLPPPEIEGDGYRIAARNLPARVVAGDFYDVFPFADGTLGVVVADVAGKGMAAALITASVKAILPFLAAERSPEQVLCELNRHLAAELSPREFVALAYARFDPASGGLCLANAGLPDPYLLLPLAGPAQPLAVPGPRLPLGVRREVEYRSLDLVLAPGERLLILTDGLPEATTANGEPLGYAALAELIGPSHLPGSAAPAVWLDALLERLRAATSIDLEDDWTALVLERVTD
ncbi:MAG TPA: PP2C family protein-serine/threonine phosphatase [Thermoanaerobaculia bacterium]|nr:PP2C family protein-serine/threonine phosphatase [Thermoanaerobaculia bacterium]